MKKEGLLVIARKYNDIFYSMSTDVWNSYDEHHLLIISHNSSKDDYPFLDKFDSVFYLYFDLTNGFHYLNIYIKLYKLLRNINYCGVCLSNVVVVPNLFILNHRKSQKVYLIEDGLMNYYDFKPNSSFLKRMLLKVLGIDPQKINNKILFTYLLQPKDGVYYYGNKKKLSILSIDFEEYGNNYSMLEGKNIFVGNDIYRNGCISVEEYSKIVNDIIIRYNIDFYVPHNLAWPTESINCAVFDVAKNRYTLEILASHYTFNIYTIMSSVSYTAKLINPQIKSTLFLYDKFMILPSDNIMIRTADNVINI